MVERLTASIMLALAGVMATTGVASAAELFGDRDGVIAGTALVVIALLAVLSVLYQVVHFLGLDKMPPPEIGSNDGHGGAHH